MRACRVSPGEYGRIFSLPSHVYNSVAFNELNRHKCDDIHYVVLRDDRERVRFGVILGLRGDVLRSPFSAPFGGLESFGRQKVSQYVEAMKALREYDGRQVMLTLPPLVYDSDGHVSAQFLASLTAGGRIVCSDYNYHFGLERFDGDYRKRLDCKVRNTLKVSLAQGFACTVTPGAGPEAISEAHKVIAVNHAEHGYPLHMSVSDLIETSALIRIDVFVVRKDGDAVAAAIVYHNTPYSRQLIYWGDMAAARAMRPMNYLAYRLFEYYSGAEGVSVFDLGPSSSDGVPATGLCDFKEGLGCTVTPKTSIML